VPILATYASIRRRSNISLIAGSGFGAADDAWPYLAGEWNVDKSQRQPMPIDGFLFASRIMVAKEAQTSPSVKDLIVQAPGVPDGELEGKETGGVLIIRSDLHQVATRAVKLWKEFDDMVFKLPKEKRAAWLVEHKAERLNKDFAKP
jgi:fatty acid synthase subunit alpha